MAVDVRPACRAPTAGNGVPTGIRRYRRASEWRLKSANPECKDDTCLAADIHIVGKILWTVGRV